MTNNEKKLKLAQAKVNQAKKQRSEEEATRVKEYERYIEQTNKYVESVVEGLGVVLETQVSESYDKLRELYKDFAKLSDHTTKERHKLEEKILEVTKALESGVRVTNIKEAKADKVTIPPLPEGLAKDATLKSIQESLKKIAKAQSEPTVSIEPASQKPPDFIPFRRVVKDGNRLIFDDFRSSGASAGGSSGGGSSGGGATTIADGADVALGFTADAAVDTDTTGTISGKLRGLVKLTVNLLSRIPAALTASGNFKTAIQEALPAGTNNIGDVDVLTLPDVNLAADVEVYENSTPLAGNGSVTSAWVDVETYSYLDAILFTDVNSATNGAVIQLSADGGTTVHKTLANTIVGGLGAYGYSIPLTGYNAFKFTYTNGTGAQAAFHIRILGGRGAAPMPLAPLGATINPTLSGVLTRAVLAGQNAAGTMSNITLTALGSVPINIAEATAEVQQKALTTLNVGQQSITGTAAQITSAATNRKTVSIKALVSNTQEVYVGTSSGVTTGNGYELAAGDAVEFDLTEGQALYAIATSGTQTICKAEVS